MVESCFQGALAIVGLPVTSDGDDQRPCAAWLLAQASSHLETVHAGKSDIEDDDFGKSLTRATECRVAIVNQIDGMAISRKQATQRLSGIDIVVHD